MYVKYAQCVVPDQRLCASIRNGVNQKVSAQNNLCGSERIAGDMQVRETKDNDNK